MTSLSDTLTIGLVLVLLFGAVALYLYTRIQQAEQKISLLESILLDMKMSAEVKSYSELPAVEMHSEPKSVASVDSVPTESYTPFEDEQDQEVKEVSTNVRTEEVDTSLDSPVDQEVEQYKSVVADAVKEESEDVLPSTSKVTTSNYDTMTLKELQALAKTRGITGAGTMKKGPIIEALKTSDKIQTHSPNDASFTGTTTPFLETSSSFPGGEQN